MLTIGAMVFTRRFPTAVRFAQCGRMTRRVRVQQAPMGELVAFPEGSSQAADRQVLLDFFEELSNITERWEIHVLVAASRARDRMLGLNP